MIAGIDFSSHRIDIVWLPEDSDRAGALVFHLGPRKLDAVERVRQARDVLPSRVAWRDAGVTRVGIEAPFSRQPSAAAPLWMTVGAIISTLPPEIRIVMLRSDDWRTALGLPLRCGRVEHKTNAFGFASRHWDDETRPRVLTSDTADAFCVAWATRLGGSCGSGRD